MNDLQSTWNEHVNASSNSAELAPAHQGASAPSNATQHNNPGAGGAPVKQIVTIRLDVDTLAWFKAGGPGYQTRINQLLREHMEAQLAQQRSAA